MHSSSQKESPFSSSSSHSLTTHQALSLMADQEVVVAPTASPLPSDHKRKLEDFEAEPESDPTQEQALDASIDADEESNDKSEAAAEADSPDAKRARLDDEKPDDGLASENGHELEKTEESTKESDEQAPTEDTELKEVEPEPKEEQETVNHEESLAENLEPGGDSEQPPIENAEAEISQEPSKVEAEQPSVDTPQQVNMQDEQSDSQKESTSRKMEVPNNKVGVLIGKAGETIRLLQYNSGAKIQITRDADADPHSATRSVELIGTPDSITKAEKLIKDVIAEADAGGSPSLVAKGLASAQVTAVAEQILMAVPNEKVGLIIGRGGETIKGLQTRSGARIQLIPQHLPEGDESKERTVRVTGDKKQIDMAKELIKEVMSQTVRASPLSSNYNQQGYRPRGPGGPPQWGQQRGPYPSQPSPYDYQQRGPYPSNPQYPPSAYGGYPSQQMGPRGGYGSGWEQRLPSSMQGPPQGGGGYDYYGGHGGRADHLPTGPHSAHGPGHSSAPSMGPPPQAPYNYGQQQGPDYGQPAPYSQAPPQQAYGHGYDEQPKYENQAPAQHYGGNGTAQPGYPGNQASHAPQQQYGKPPSYGMPPSQGPVPQTFGPRASQPGEMPYQGPTAAQPYGQNVAPQQSYPYASTGSAQQTYPPYGSAPAANADGYTQQQPPASGPGYPQQAGQPVQGYNQPTGQPAAGYVQVGPTGAYGQYPATQGYAEQPASNNAAYGYQAPPQDPAYSSATGPGYGAPAGGQAGYAQPVPVQPGYDQSGGYGGVQGSAPATQMYAAPR